MHTRTQFSKLLHNYFLKQRWMLVREEPSVYVFTFQTQAGLLTERKAKSNKKRQNRPQRQLNDYRERQNNLREQETTTKKKKNPQKNK